MAWVDIRRLQEDDSESHAPHDLDMVPLLRMDSLQDLRADVKKRVQTYICNSFQKELRLGVCVWHVWRDVKLQFSAVVFAETVMPVLTLVPGRAWKIVTEFYQEWII